MDVYEDVFVEVVTTNRFDENVDLSTTYLGKICMKRGRHNEDRGKLSHLRTRFCYGKNIEWRGMSNIIRHRCASKSYMSKSYYLRCKALHDLPKFASKIQRI